MSDREWWETAQQLGLSWLSPRKDCSPSDEILCMLSDLCTKENLPPPSYQQFPAASGTFSSICQVGHYTKESYGESADIALRNAAVTMLIFLKELKATAVTHQLKEKKNDMNLPSLHKEILKENKYDVDPPTLHKKILSFQKENGRNCVRKDEDEMFQKRFARENGITQYDKLEHKSRLENRPPDGIKKVYLTSDTSCFDRRGSAATQTNKQSQKCISNPKKPMNRKEVQDFGSPCTGEGRTKNKKSSKREKHNPPVMVPQGQPSDYTKQNLKDYPPEILEMYQSYQKECQSNGEDLLPLEEIWNQCVADSILPDNLTTFQETTHKKTLPSGNETTFEPTMPKKTPPNGIQMNQFQSRIKNLSESNQSNLQETSRFKDGKHYRSDMIHHASSHTSNAHDQTFRNAHTNGHLTKADQMFRHANGHLSKSDHEMFRHDKGRLTNADVQTLRHTNYHLSKADHETFRHDDGRPTKADHETFRHDNGRLTKADQKLHHANGHLSKADQETFHHDKGRLTKADVQTLRHANGHLSKVDQEMFRHDGGCLTKADHETFRHHKGRLTKADVQMLRHANGHLSKAGHEMYLQLVRHASGHLSRTDGVTFSHTNDHLSQTDHETSRHASGHLSQADHEKFLPMGKDVPKFLPEERHCKVQENVIFESRGMLPGPIEDESRFQNSEANDSMDELSQDFILKLEKMQIEKISPQKHKSLNGFFLILRSSRNPGIGKLRYSKLVGDHVAQLEEICEEENIAFEFEEEEIEVHRGVDDEWLSVLRLGHDMEFIGNGTSSGEAKQMACLSALQYIKIMTR